jgi:hypothetical protein
VQPRWNFRLYLTKSTHRNTLTHSLHILQMLRPYKESHSDAEVLYSALSAMQDKNLHLENSLSAETRIKLDLFSALGEVKRQLEIRDSECRIECINIQKGRTACFES